MTVLSSMSSTSVSIALGNKGEGADRWMVGFPD
jgi:hypothetical protein